MATFTWNYYGSTGPAWTSISTNTVVFSGTGGLATPITVGSYNDETHIGTGDPGTDTCGANHARNVKYISGTQFDSGSGTETISDANLLATECTLQIKFADAASVATSNGRFYAYDGSAVANEAVGVTCYAFEQGKGNTAWVLINDDAGNTGGDNTGERMALSDQTAGTEHYFYVAVSASPQSVGAKTQFDFGIALTYS